MDGPLDSKPGGTRLDFRLGRIVLNEISRCVWTCLGSTVEMFGICSGYVWTNYDDVNDVVISDDVAFELETM